ncbi:uncharacterized protein atf7ip2 [Lycodopsis pacificus]
MADHTGSKIPAPKRGRPSSKGKSPKQHTQALRETRVAIGLAFDRWRELKTTNGLKTDAEVALSLLDVMKSPTSSPASFGAPAKKLKFSQLEVETLIEQEVHAAVQKKESKLQGLIETIQQLDQAVDYSSSIQELEARINTVTKRAEAAIAFMTEEQKKSPLPSLVNVNTREHSEDETLEAETQTDMKSEEVFEMMENTKEALKKMQADNKALKGATTHLSEELPPPVLTPYGSPEGKELKVKKEPKYKQEIQNNVVEFKRREEPKAAPVKVETKHTNSERDKVPYPPLPVTPFPSTLSMEAAQYNIPQIVEVKMALIRRPPSLSVSWLVKEKDPSKPPMDVYRVFISVEKEKGSNVFPAWTPQDVDAKNKEQCIWCHVTNKYQPGRKVCVAVVGKDAFGRYGPYSEVVTVSLPD